MVTITARRVSICLTIVTVALTRLHVVAANHHWPTHMFDVGAESSIPTWYSSFVLLVAAMLIAIIAFAQGRKPGTYWWHWVLLSVWFLYMSIDEVAAIHERWADFVSLPDASGAFSFEWVMVGVPFVIVMGLAYVRFVFHLPPPARLLVIAAGAIYLGGALGMEMLGARELDAHGGSYRYFLLNTTEEFMEMFGVVVLIHALLSYIGKELKGVSVAVGEKQLCIGTAQR